MGIKKAESYVQSLLCHDASGHDYGHCIRVKNLALKIAESYDCDKNLVALASVLHDVDDEKVFGHVGHKHLVEFCRKNNLDAEYQNIIISIIDFLSLDLKDDTVSIETHIVQHADNLDALGAVGIARMFAFGGANGKVVYDGTSTDSFSHYYQRLEKLPNLMNTPFAKDVAKKRIKFMQNFMAQFKKETL